MGITTYWEDRGKHATPLSRKLLDWGAPKRLVMIMEQVRGYKKDIKVMTEQGEKVASRRTSRRRVTNEQHVEIWGYKDEHVYNRPHGHATKSRHCNFDKQSWACQKRGRSTLAIGKREKEGVWVGPSGESEKSEKLTEMQNVSNTGSREMA